MHRLRKLALRRQVTLTDIVIWVITQATEDIELTPDDYKEIARETEAARLGKPKKRKSYAEKFPWKAEIVRLDLPIAKAKIH